MTPVVDMTGITCRSGDHVCLENVSLTLPEGQRVLITGPLASGKGQLLRLIIGTARAESGKVVVFGQDIAALEDADRYALRKRIGVVLHDSVLISNLKVIENVALPLIYHLGMSHSAAADRAMTLLQAAGYSADAWELPGNVPYYARKEAAIARAFALDPEIILCETLSEGLTASEAARMARVLAQYQKGEAKRLLVFTSDREEEAHLVRPDRVVRVEGLRLLEHE